MFPDPGDPGDDLAAFNLESLRKYGIWDGGATRSCGGHPQVQDIVDHSENVLLGESDVTFTFAGGEGK